MKDKELELLREYFDNDKDGCKGKNKSLKERILEIQKQNKLKRRIKILNSRLVSLNRKRLAKEFNEILKELGYEH